MQMSNAALLLATTLFRPGAGAEGEGKGRGKKEVLDQADGELPEINGPNSHAS